MKVRHEKFEDYKIFVFFFIENHSRHGNWLENEEFLKIKNVSKLRKIKIIYGLFLKMFFLPNIGSQVNS